MKEGKEEFAVFLEVAMQKSVVAPKIPTSERWLNLHFLLKKVSLQTMEFY